ncbi:hypothetical protein D6D05_02151 [Aureobasidium pullulans]|nr:hypothetical protein D6D05_02151 [Aureobasidium pullulans]
MISQLSNTFSNKMRLRPLLPSLAFTAGLIIAQLVPDLSELDDCIVNCIKTKTPIDDTAEDKQFGLFCNRAARRWQPWYNAVPDCIREDCHSRPGYMNDENRYKKWIHDLCVDGSPPTTAFAPITTVINVPCLESSAWPATGYWEGCQTSTTLTPKRTQTGGSKMPRPTGPTKTTTKGPIETLPRVIPNSDPCMVNGWKVC